MHVIDVIPLSPTAPGVLSYRSRSDLPVGTIVEIMLRKTPTQGIVLSSLPVSHAKEMLKRARFLLSKSAPAASGMLPSALLTAATETAEYNATSVGAVLASLLQEYIRSGTPIPTLNFSTTQSAFRLQTSEKAISERAKEYLQSIDECLEKNQSVLLVVPTLPELEFWKKTFSSYKPLVLSGALTGARRARALESATQHVGLIIATPSFSWTPISSLGHIVIDRVSAGTYTLPKRPYLSVVHALEFLARARNIPITYGDFPLPVEYRPDPTQPIKDGITNASLLDVRTDPDDQKAKDTPWKAIPIQLVEKIKKEIESGGSVVILTARTGYAPRVVCRDCGQALSDERGMPLSFTQANGKRVFKTSDGKSVIDAKMNCPRCGSWNLQPLGIGLERVAEELQKECEGVPIIVASADALRTSSKIKVVMAQVVVPGTITVGTESLLPLLLAHQIPNFHRPLGIIASADSLLAVPFWRARERFVRLCYFFSGLCQDVVLVSRHAEDSAVSAVLNGSTSEFWKEECALRRAVHYPPFGTLITLSEEGSEKSLDASASREAFELLAPYAPVTLPDQRLTGASVRRTIVLQLSEGSWPSSTLPQLLQGMPPSVKIRIDPESVW